MKDFTSITTPENILIDASSFIKKTKLKTYIFEHSVMFEELALAFNVRAIFLRDDGKIATFFKSMFSGSKPPSTLFYGEKYVLDIVDLRNVIKQLNTPLFYNGELSDDRFLSLPAKDTLQFPSNLKTFYTVLGNYFAENTNQDKYLKPLDTRKAHTMKVFSAGTPSRFGDKFNV